MNLNYQLIKENTDRKICLMQFSLTSVKTDCFVSFIKNPEAITQLDITFPVNIPEQKSESISSPISALNTRIETGLWHMNNPDGCLCFSISYPRHKDSKGFDEDFIANLQKGLTMVDYCTPGLLSVAFGNQEPEEVAREIWRSVGYPEN
jgi:hypothetical protein